MWSGIQTNFDNTLLNILLPSSKAYNGSLKPKVEFPMSLTFFIQESVQSFSSFLTTHSTILHHPELLEVHRPISETLRTACLLQCRFWGGREQSGNFLKSNTVNA